MNEDTLIIGGFNMRLAAVALGAAVAAAGAVHSIEPYFNMFPGAVLRECEQNNDANRATPADVRGKKRIIAYSYGVSTVWDLFFNQDRSLLDGEYDDLVIVAGVNDVFKGQGATVWHAPACFKRVLCIQVNVIDPAPVSHQLHNPGAITIDVDTPDDDPRWNAELLNVNCDSLVRGLDEISKHTTIENHPRVIAIIQRRLAA